MMIPKFSRKDLVLNLVFFLVYLSAGKLGLKFATIHPNATTIWPPTGIALVGFLFFGYRIWPAIFLGALFTNLTTAGSLFTSFGIAAGNTLEGVTGAFLVGRFAGGKEAFNKPENLLKYVILAGFISTLISASMGVISLYLGGYLNLAGIFSVWLTWWLGDMGGNLIFAPFILLFNRKSLSKWKPDRLIEGLGALILLYFVTRAVFSGIFIFPYMIIPILILIAFRFDLWETSLSVVVLSGLAIWYTVRNQGPFVTNSASINQSLLSLQLFLGTSSILSLIVASVISDQKRTKNSLKKSEELYRTIFELAPDVIYSLSNDGKFISLSPAFEKITGWSPSEWIGKNFTEIVYPSDLEKAVDFFKKGIVGKVTSDFQLRILTKSGKYVIGEFHSVPNISEGNILGKIGIARDITQRVQTDQELKLSKQELSDERDQLERIINAIGEGVMVIDNNYRIILINIQAQKLLGIFKNKIIGQDMRKIQPLYQGNEVVTPERRIFIRTFKSGKLIHTVMKDNLYYLSADNKKIPVVITTAPLISGGKVTGVVNVFRDITIEKSLDAMKDEFLSIAAHQLRTPLGLIRWNTELLLEKGKNKLNEDIRRTLLNIYGNTKQMVGLVNDLMDVSRIDQGKIQLVVQKTDLSEIINKTLIELKPVFDSKKIKLEVDLPGKDRPVVKADPNRLRDIIRNLISNAVKYNKPGGKVSLQAGIRGKFYQVSIKDTGIGIPDDEKDKIFTKFYRASNAKSLETSGTGLGLYVVKSYIEAMKGKITFKSTLNKATEFIFTIPYEKNSDN